MNADPEIYRFGFWPSPISAGSVAQGALRFGRVQVADGAVYWSEGRPAEKGRTQIMRWSEARGLSELLLLPFSARSKVHEYGGGEFLVSGGVLYFVNDADQDVYAVDISAVDASEGIPSIRRLTERPDTRFADMAFDRKRGRLIVVGERHDIFGHKLPENALWIIPATGANPSANTAVKGRDFYASPRLNPDCNKLAYLAWDLPDMPWDSAALYVTELMEDGQLGETIHVAGGAGMACFQPEWGKDGALYFVCDTGASSNLFRWFPGASPVQLTHLDAELSRGLWSFNAASYAFGPGEQVFLSYFVNGNLETAVLDLQSNSLTPRQSAITALSTLSADEERAAFIAMTDEEPLSIAIQDWASPAPKSPVILRRSSNETIEAGYVSRPQRIEIPGESGPVFGMLYPPQNPHARGPVSAKPPLIINLHGGPTGAAARGLKPRTLFFTSRGFSWLDLDYSGSTGYGRHYRDRLKGNWGVADVADTIAAAEFAVSSGLADANSLFVSGGSAGGYTVLMAVATSSIFRGAASYYGICDLIGLQKTTHKFEHGYLVGLLGAPLVEESEALYKSRSALSHADRITTPLIIFQGADDQVVPKEQSRTIAEVLRERRLPVEYHEFEGEGHGFRRADTISRSLDLELDFYRGLLS